MAMIIILEYYGYIKMENIQNGVLPKLEKLKKYSKIMLLAKKLDKKIKSIV